MFLGSRLTASSTDERNAVGLLILRFFLGIFLLHWSIEKLILPDTAVRISQSFYNISLPVSMPYLLGSAELVLSIALIFGLFRTASYGLALAIHTVTVMVSWRQLIDPYGLAKIGNHLWIATWPTFGGFVALFLMRKSDLYTIDEWRLSTVKAP
jgi:putative oxidoreductase